MTKANYRYLAVQYLSANSELFWVENKTFHIKYGDVIVLENKFSTKLMPEMVRVVRRTNTKPQKGQAQWLVAAVTNQFPVAENEQVVACDHVAPAPMSIALIRHELAVARDQMANAIARIEKQIQGLKNDSTS